MMPLAYMFKVGCQFSDKVKITSGVVQGSCLGPLLFVVFINDLPTAIKPPTKSEIYADDKIYEKTTSLYQELHLQGNINIVETWSIVSDMSLSSDKCYVFCICPRNSTYSPPAYFLNISKLELKDSVRDLGLIVDKSLTFVKHINDIVKKASIRSSLIFKCFLSHDGNSLLRAFIVYVRPVLEYCSHVWSPHCKKYIDEIESVQRRFTKRLPGLQNLTYQERLKFLQLETLEFRRLKSDMILLYKIFFRQIDTDFSKFIELHSYTSTRGHPYKLGVPFARTDTFKYSFVRTFPVWNSLTKANFASLENFKSFLTYENLDHFLSLKINL